MQRKISHGIYLLGTAVGIAAGVFLAVLIFNTPAFADTNTDLQQKINDHSSTIQQLQDEINRVQAELDKTSSQAKDLQTTVKTLDLNSKKISTDIKVTENKIGSTNLSIQQLALAIAEKEKKVSQNQQAVMESIRKMYETDNDGLLLLVLSNADSSSILDETGTFDQLNAGLRTHIQELEGLKKDMQANKSASEQKKNDLLGLKSQLADQKTSVEITKQTKAELLSETKDKESAYKQIVADKIAKKKAFEAELLQYESQLKHNIDPKSIPASQTGILAWPLDKHIITQYFGNTLFAQAHAAVYNGSGHNGIDIGAAVGTPIKAALSGTIQGTGNTDTTCPGASYGKWILIKHDNGLSTLYAHLSLISAQVGQQVSTGDTIGYSGMTGYATGPHLHFTVYASQGVEIDSRPSKSCGGRIYTMPFSDLKAYLNPLDYL